MSSVVAYALITYDTPHFYGQAKWRDHYNKLEYIQLDVNLRDFKAKIVNRLFVWTI